MVAEGRCTGGGSRSRNRGGVIGMIRGLATVCALVGISVPSPGAVPEQTARISVAKTPVTEEGSVERVQFETGEISISPDGEWLAYVSVRPQLADNENVWSLTVQPLDKVGGGASNGRTLFQLSSLAFLGNGVTGIQNRPISNIKWLNDSHSIIFKRQLKWDSDASDICVVNIATGELRVLYSFPGAIRELSISQDGDVAALYLIYPQDELRSEEMEQNGFHVDRALFVSFQARRLWQAPRRQIVLVNGLVSGTPTIKIVEEYQHELERTSPYVPNLSMSPDGRHLVYTRLVANLPEKWQGVKKDEQQVNAIRSFLRPPDFGLNLQLTIYEVADEGKRIAFNHPKVTFETVAWSDDSAWFAVHGPCPLPAERIRTGVERDDDSDLYVVGVSDLKPILVSSAKANPRGAHSSLSSRLGNVLAWRNHGKEMVLSVGVTSIQTVNFKRHHWRIGRVVELLMPQPTYWFGELRVGTTGIAGRLESSSISPDIYYWRRGDEEKPPERLTELNPQLMGFTFGHVEKVSWRNKFGAKSVGYLIVPPEFEAQKKYPAVLMLKDWTDMFIMDGQLYSTAFAPQTLANDGFVVLLAAAPTPEEQPDIRPGKMGYNINEMAMVESAIEMLDKQNLIDLGKVGISGFSVTSWQTQFILTNSQFPFAAASTADAWNLNYVSYATQNLHGSPHGYDMGYAFDHLYGGPPFGKTLKNWIDFAPAFNTSKVLAPVLTEACGDGVTTAPAFEWFTALHKLGKPVEFYMYPDGQHLLQTPKERLASSRLNVDWFRFWLQGYEREAPEYDRDRYVRWRQLREQHEKNQRAIAAGKDPAEEYQNELRAEGWLPPLQ
jgi:dipeptidyl aminopeptidase/acylaminoacyl peptidase